MITVACVLHTPPFYNRRHKVEYTPDHVRMLKRQVERHSTLPHRFVCLSDVDIDGVVTIPLEHGWAGWWSKMELFKNFDEAFYLDLDTVIVGNIDKYLEADVGRIQVLRNLSPVEGTSKRIGSGIMLWKKDYFYLYEKFREAPEKYMAEYITSSRWGDQGFIQDHVEKFGYLQERFPKSIVSYKFGMKQEGNPPDGCDIVCFHGQPKPWDASVINKHQWAKERCT